MPITARTVEYTTAEGLTLQSYLCLPQQPESGLAGVLVAPEWWGLSGHAKRAAERLAEQGYAAMAMDLYGDARLTDDAAQANEWMSAALADPATLVGRTRLGLQALAAQPEVDGSRIGAIGFCFGGRVVLDMARRGEDLKAVASFHGILATPEPARKGSVKGELLIEHAGLDSMVPMEAVEAFRQEMDHAQARYHIDVFPHAKHGFTNPQATCNGEKNGVDLAYNEADAEAAWQNMLGLLARAL
ncbi:MULTISPECIES: dienelactone hydrolase family protein [unclassified Neisseria]|uniref:dienelactone hydrolase family protein n=1 Tax=unclassified Neisseria TaxID=2623750 RepID=UPI0010729C84|nr:MULTISPECIES: dienelactone hydrolase family protein [unclassified Neisseria]MBF0803151.1 dienelactone hydrolase family protein [Neisseria sp. 19428wB4_WF04]TFU44272.1 dienelactone hydrolase family protein [Neisseria sp. WF04]